MVVLFAVEFPIPEIAAGGEGLLTRRALQTLLVPGRLVDAHQEAVGDGALAALAHRGMRAVGACDAQGGRRGETRLSAPTEPSPSFTSKRPRSRSSPGSDTRTPSTPLLSNARCARGESAAGLEPAIAPTPGVLR